MSERIEPIDTHRTDCDCGCCSIIGEDESVPTRLFANGMAGTAGVPMTGEVDVDAVLVGIKWAQSHLTYSFGQSAADYGGYGTSDEPYLGFEPVTDAIAATARSAFANIAAVANLTFEEFSGPAAGEAVIRFGMTSDAPTAHAYTPNAGARGGDVWFNNGGSFDTPVRGRYAWLTVIHEIGHAIGLMHPHESTPTGTFAHDNMAYTVMSYRSYPGASAESGFRNEAFGYAQTLMMFDIAALQTMYGANYNHQVGNTVYQWSEGSGEMFVDGAGQGAPGANRIFLTVWDGGGSDTYDFSAWGGPLSVDLRPGAWTSTGDQQTALLDRNTGVKAIGNIANAMLVGGDTRALIENANGGSGNDVLHGNEAANILSGGGGADSLFGYGGGDLFRLEGGGSDRATGGDGNDGFYFGAQFDAADLADGGAGDDQVALQGTIDAVLGGTALVGIESVVLLSGSDARFGAAGANRYSYNLALEDSLIGGGQNLVVNANGLLAGENLFLRSAETDGSFTWFAGLGVDNVGGGGKDDGFFFGDGGRFTGADRVIGGGGNDQLGLRGDYSAQVVFEAGTLQAIDTIVLLSASDARFGAAGGVFNYALRSHDGNLAAGEALVVSGIALAANEVVRFDGSQERDGLFQLRGGGGNDILTGGFMGDVLFGGIGADTLEGGGGGDIFYYRSVVESSVGLIDTIVDFATGDRIDLSAIDAIFGGSDDAFAFIGSAAFGGVAGQLRASAVGGGVMVQGDVNGDGAADLAIFVAGGTTLVVQGSDFFL